jgi:hypothetical protein
VRATGDLVRGGRDGSGQVLVEHARPRDGFPPGPWPERYRIGGVEAASRQPSFVESNVVRNIGYWGGVERPLWVAVQLLLLVDAICGGKLNPTDQKVRGSNPFGRAVPTSQYG